MRPGQITVLALTDDDDGDGDENNGAADAARRSPGCVHLSV